MTNGEQDSVIQDSSSANQLDITERTIAPHGDPDIWRAIPRQIPKFWLEGRFNLASYPSDRYNTLGWSLLLRGIYWYEVHNAENNDYSHGGVALLDFDGDSSDLSISGLRLAGKGKTPQLATWKSTMCKLEIGAGGGAPAASFQFAYSWQIIDRPSDDPSRIDAQKIADFFCDARRRRKTNIEQFIKDASDPKHKNLLKYVQEFAKDLDRESSKPQYALVICRKIQELGDSNETDFSFKGIYLPTADNSASETIAFYRLQ